MSGGNATPGVTPVRTVFLLAGAGLLMWSWASPSIHIIWAVPLGLLMFVSALGKMVAR